MTLAEMLRACGDSISNEAAARIDALQAEFAAAHLILDAGDVPSAGPHGPLTLADRIAYLRNREETGAGLAATIGRQSEELRETALRLADAMQFLSQVRHVSGDAQSHMRSQLRFIDAVLAGADLRDLETVEAIVDGTWRPAR